MSQNLPIPLIDINLYAQPDGSSLLNFQIQFEEWFTILCGPNGTGKSATLSKIKEAYRDKSFLYNPKRNSERKNILQKFQEIERSGQRKAEIVAGFIGKMFNDNTFDPYYSFPEIIAYDYFERYKTEGKTKNGGQIIDELKGEYEKLVKQIFPAYELINWDFRNGAPYFQVQKFSKYIFESEQLSTGEQEILSLVFNIHFFKDSFEILLIDEPEIHLNWALEENLFIFLKKFAQAYKKQVVITTHARIIFEDKFKDSCKFLYFDSSRKIIVSNQVPEPIKREISGDIVKFVISGEDSKTIFVEDSFHETVINQLLSIAGKDKNLVNIQGLNGKTAIATLYAGVTQKQSRGLFKEAYFLVDGDGQADPHPGDHNYIKLLRYCLESYFVDFVILARISGKTQEQIKKLICQAINIKKQKEGKLLLLGEIVPTMLKQKNFIQYDCSYFLSELITQLGYSQEQFIQKYLEDLKVRRKLKRVFDKKLIDFIYA